MPKTYTIPAGTPVQAVPEKHADAPIMWGRYLKKATTSRVNTFTDEDLVKADRITYTFRLKPNDHGLALLIVPADAVTVSRADVA